MSKRNKEKSSEEEKNSDDCATVSRLHLSCFLSKSDDNQHVCRDSSKAGSTLKEGSLLSSEKPHSTATLCTRGPGRPRIHVSLIRQFAAKFLDCFSLILHYKDIKAAS